MADARRTDAKAARKIRQAQRRDEERRAAEESQTHLTTQLNVAQSARARLRDEMRELNKKIATHSELSNHLEGFYAEIDKLAKGKSLLEVTDLVLQHSNDIIRDSKALINGDTYLNRIKEFVPAGNNPLYPDVVVALREVRQILERFGLWLEQAKARLQQALTRAVTVATGVQLRLEGHSMVLQDTVKHLMDNKPIDGSCFLRDSLKYESYFDFDRLDRLDLVAYFSGVDEVNQLGGQEQGN